MSKNIFKNELIISAITSLFSVVFLWWFWDNGIYALWFNASVFGILFIRLFLFRIDDKKQFVKNNLYWLLPIVFITLSFSIYENPFLKVINIFLLPIISLLFFGYSITKFEWNKIWWLKMVYEILRRKIYLWKSVKKITEYINYWDNTKKTLFKKIFFWLLIFVALDSIIISLLIWADSNFWKIISELWLIINLQSITKIISFLFILVLLMWLHLYWAEEYIIKNEEEKNIDSVISWIVLWWTLFTYFLFIWVHLDSILISSLPANIENVANLVKSWFWQLFFVSIINIIFFFIYYKKTNDLVQKLLIIFIFASFIILISAWNKMFMYIYQYGFSYEKFFASYTILYFWVLFIIMSIFLFIKKKMDILKTSLSLALCMYAGLNILPTEQIIFKTNTIVANRQGSSIQKYQSHILSIDILSSVKKLKWSNLYNEQNWDWWIKKRLDEIKNKKWYEKNIHNFYN